MAARTAPLARDARRPSTRLPVLAALTAGLLAVFASRRAAADPADSADTPELGPRADSSPHLQLDEYPPPAARRNLLIAGGVTTAVWYGLALGSSFIWPDAVGAKDLRIPVAGPWLALSHSGCGNVSDCSKVIVVLRAIATTIDAIGQASGVAIAAEGLFLPTREPKRAQPEARSDHVQWQPTFDAGQNSVGFGVLGVF
jgi:hypothetical protein